MQLSGAVVSGRKWEFTEVNGNSTSKWNWHGVAAARSMNQDRAELGRPGYRWSSSRRSCRSPLLHSRSPEVSLPAACSAISKAGGRNVHNLTAKGRRLDRRPSRRVWQCLVLWIRTSRDGATLCAATIVRAGEVVRTPERDCTDPAAPPHRKLCRNFLWPLNAPELVIPHEPEYLAELIRDRRSLERARIDLLPDRFERY
jgi:hypothetical protein